MEDTQILIAIVFVIMLVIYIPVSNLYRIFVGKSLGCEVKWDIRNSLFRSDPSHQAAPSISQWGLWTYSIKNVGYEKWNNNRRKLSLLISFFEILFYFMYVIFGVFIIIALAVLIKL